MQTYDGNVEIITNIGTSPDERGLTTDQFKAKFDEGLKSFVEWFNNTHKTEFEAISTSVNNSVTSITNLQKSVEDIKFLSLRGVRYNG